MKIFDYCVIVAVASTCAQPLNARQPSEYEQYYLELINRARADPDAEVNRLAGFKWDGAPDLNEGIAPGTISNVPKPPLAFNRKLLNAASDYTDVLLANEAFTHFFNGTNPSSRMKAAGYFFQAPSGSSENIAWTAAFPNNPLNASAVEQHHRGLFIDRGYAGRGHRINLMDPDLREAGVAIRKDKNGVSAGGVGFVDIGSTQDFAYSNGRIFVTGVAYDDKDGNGFYTPNKGEPKPKAGIQILDGNGNVVATGKTFRSGGYSINIAGLPAGTYTLKLTETSGKEVSETFTFDGIANVKVDVVGDGSNAGLKKKLKKRIKRLKKKRKAAVSILEKRRIQKKIKKLRRRLRKL